MYMGSCNNEIQVYNNEPYTSTYKGEDNLDLDYLHKQHAGHLALFHTAHLQKGYGFFYAQILPFQTKIDYKYQPQSG